MKTYTIELTAAEIDALQVCITSDHMILEEEVARLKSHNDSGINNYKIKYKRNRMKVCDQLWDKLYNAKV